MVSRIALDKSGRRKTQLRKKRGIWVFRSGEPLSEETVRKTLEKVRREREKQILGKSVSSGS